MKITVLTLFKEQFDGFLNTSIIKRIIDKGLVEIKIVDIRDYSLATCAGKAMNKISSPSFVLPASALSEFNC